MAALDSGSAVKTEQWITGPDGERDMDVEVRGTLNGVPHFILVECKDHARPIGIGFVDAFESKIRDLKPDQAIMFSNSGFTKDALRKANRVGIEMASAMKADDHTVKIRVHREVIARRLTLSMEEIRISPFDGHTFDFVEWQPTDLTFDGIPLTYWVAGKMKSVAAEHDEAKEIKFFCTFRPDPRWAYQGVPIQVGGLFFRFGCKKDWVAQTVNADVSLGYYNHIKKNIMIPDKQWYALGAFDNEAWEETDKKWEHGEMEPTTFRLDITMTRSNLPNSPGPPPNVEEVIAEARVDIE